MRVIIQRVSHASVRVDKKIVGSIEHGFMLLVGIHEDDTQAHIDKFVSKIVNMRIFEDEQEKMNLSIQDVKGSILSVSQFTLYADCKKGNRPGFSKAAKPEIAKALYDKFNEALKMNGIPVETGVFGAFMEVDLCNDGPTTIILDSEEIM